MLNQSLFTKNAGGRVTQLESFFILFPGKENSFQILFGGKVLELMDEISGSLANLYIARPNYQTVHVGEEVLFLEPIRSSETGKVIARVLLVTEKIICIFIEVWGGKASEPDNFTRRYAGFGLCAVVNEKGEMIKDLTPYRDPSDTTKYAEQVVEFQRTLRKSILQTR